MAEEIVATTTDVNDFNSIQAPDITSMTQETLGEIDPPKKTAIPKQESYEDAMNKAMSSVASKTPYFGTGLTGTKYVDYEANKKYLEGDFGYIQGRDNEDLYAQNQEWYTEIPKAIPKLVGYTLTKLGTGVGFTLGLLDPASWTSADGVVSAASDNAISTTFAALEDTIKNDWAPTFQEAADRNKGFFSRAFTDLNFWTEDVVDGAAFMASAFIPGMALSKLGAGVKFAQLMSELRIGANAANAVVDGVSMAQNYLSNAQKIAKSFDAFTTWATATASEAMFEAKETRDNVLKSLENKINPNTGEVYTDDERKSIAGGAARNTFLMNATLLGLTNAVQLRYMYKALGMTAPGTNGIASTGLLGSAFTSEIPTSKLGRFLASNTGKALQGAAAGIVSEGYVEENTQLAIQRINEKYGSQGKVFDLLNYGEVIKQAGKQIVDATMGDDQEASMSIGLGALLGGGMATVGEVREAKRERLNTDNAIQLLNTTQNNWLKFGDIFQTEEVIKKDDKGNDLATIQTKVDDKGDPIVDQEKLISVISGLKTNMDQMKAADIASDPAQVQYLRDSAFRDFVQAHVDAGIEDTLIWKLDEASRATPQALAAMGFDPNSRNVSEMIDMESFADTIIRQNKLINNSVLRTGTPEQEQARIGTLIGLATDQTILNRIVERVAKDSDSIKSSLIGFDISSGSDSAVDIVNELQYRIISQERSLEALKANANVSSFQIKAAEAHLKELEAKKSKFLKDNSLTFENLTPLSDGTYKYENAQRNSDPLNKAYQLSLMQKGAYQNQARVSGIQFAYIADTKSGMKNFLEHLEQDVVNPINSALDAEEANQSTVPGNSITITTTNNGQPFEQEITEGEEYVTAANEENKLFRGKVAKTYNNNLIKVLSINGDAITIRVNNDKTYTISPERFSDAGRLWKLSDMSVDERLYFKNRDIAFNMNVFGKTGKLHSIKGDNAGKDFSKAGIYVKSRLVLQGENGENVLKISYINPVTKKTEIVPYNRAYLAKYGDQKFDLRSLPGEQEALDQLATERTARNLNTQLQIFNQRIADAQNRLTTAQAEQIANQAAFEALRNQLIDDRAELELVIEELDKYANKRGRRSVAHNALIKLKGDISTRIIDAQNQLDTIKAERVNLENLVEELKLAKSLYEDTVLELEINEVPFDRNGNESLSSSTQEEYDRLQREQVTRRLSSERVDDLITDTQNEISYLTDKINSLTGYISDLKQILKRVGIISDFMDFQDLPASVADRKGFREYLAQKIGEATDPTKKSEYQELYRQLQKGAGLKGGISFRDMMFLISSLRDSVNDLQNAEQQLAETEEKFDRLKAAQAQKAALSTLQERIDYLNLVQSVITEDVLQPVVTPVAQDVTPKDQTELQSDTLIDTDPYSATFGNEKLPKFEQVGFNKTFGRQYKDDQDQDPVTDNGAPRFFQFTSSQNVANQNYNLLVVTDANDTFGIRQEGFPNDIKLVVVKNDDQGLRYIGQDGQVLESPNRDNIVYTSMANINSWTPERVRQSYSVASTTTDEDIKRIIDEHKVYQQNLVSLNKISPVYLKAVNTSPGIQRVEVLSSVGEDGKAEIAKAPTEGRVIEENPDWTDLRSANNPDVNIELRVSTANGAIAPGILPGRIVMQEFTYDGDIKLYGDKIVRVFNRPLENSERDDIILALMRMTNLFGRKNNTDPDLRLSESEQAELDLIQNYLSGVLAWGNPETEGTAFRSEESNRFFFIQNGLNRGSFKIPFTEQAILDNQSALLDGVFHHVNNRLLKSNQEFNTIKIENDRVVPGKTYGTYQEYLLAKRETGLPPVYTSLPRVDSGIPQRTQSFINWVDSNVEQPTIEVPNRQVTPKPQVQPKPTTPSTSLGGLFALAEQALSAPKPVAPATGGLADLLNMANKALEDAAKQNIIPDPVSPSKPDTQTEKLPDVPSSIDSTNVTEDIPVILVDQSFEVDSDGQVKYFDIESAVANAKPVNKTLSATLWSKNVLTGETIVVVSSTVNIPDGNIKVARQLLRRDMTNNLPNDDEAPYREVTQEEVTKLEDFKALESFMSKNLPQIPINKMSQLIAGKAWGQFYNGSIYIYENAEIGTGFHEAFEAVWASYLTDVDQARLSKEFRSRQGEFTNPFTRESKPYSEASDYDVREMLAEEFRAHVLNDGTPGSSKIVRFFNELWNAIKALFGLSPNTTAELNGNINRVFNKIGKQGFKRTNPIVERSQISPAYRVIPGLNQDESNSAVEGLTYYFFMNLFKDNKSIDTILSELTPEESRTFVNRLFDISYNKVLENTLPIGNSVSTVIKNSKDILFNELKTNLSRFGLTFDEDILNKEETATDTLGIRDTITVDPQKMTGINVKLLIASLPNSTYESKTGKVKILTNILNQPTLVDYAKTHNMLLNELANIVPYVDADGRRIEALDQMFEKLDDKHRTPKGYYKPGYAWIKNLKLRLRYEDLNGVRIPTESLTDDDIRLRISFIKSFTNNKNLPEKTIIGPEGYLYNLNPINNVNTDRVKQEWLNNIVNNYLDKKYNTITIESNGTRVFNKNGSDYKFLMDTLNDKNSMSLDRALEALDRLGIVFTSGKQQLNKYESTIKENTIQILSLMQAGTINTVSDLYGSSKVSGRIDKFMELEARFTAEDTILSYLNSDGQSQYSVGIPSLFGQMLNIVNSVGSLKALVQTAPWLGNIDSNGEVRLFGYNANSELLRKGGPLFNSRGTRRPGAPLNYHVISGLGTSDFDGKPTAVLQFPERVANEIHYLLRNIVYSNINSDKSTEFGIGIPGKPLASVSALSRLLYQDSSPAITDIYINQLTDELYTALDNTRNPSNVEFYRNQVERLGHFRDVMGQDFVDKFKKEVLDSNTRIYTSPNAHLEFLRANRADIESTINSYIKGKTEETMQFLLNLDLFELDPRNGNDLYTTDAIDNESLREFLGASINQKVSINTGDEIIERQGFSESNLRVLSAFLAVNKELLLTEQHKLIYGHPVFYKDLPKRANGATSTKEQMVEDQSILNWMDDKMPRNDGKSRSEEKHQTMKVISFKDSEVLSSRLTSIAEGVYKGMISTNSKEETEKYIGATFDESGKLTSFIMKKNKNKPDTHTGILAPYAELNEADAQAWGMPDIMRDMLYLTGKLTKEQAAQFDYEMAYEKIALSERGEKYTKQQLETAREVLAKGNPGYIFQVLKPQYFGYAEDPTMMHPTFLKNSVQPKFFRHVEGTQFEDLYLAAKSAQVDVIGFQSGEKVGNVENPEGGFTSLYNNSGQVNVVRTSKGLELPAGLAQQKLYTKFWGIQVEMSSKAKNTVVRGTQVTKLIMVNSYENGAPINSEVGSMIDEYNNTLKEMMANSKKDLIRELGLRVTPTGYETEDITSLVNTLRDEAVKRELPDNIISGIASMMNENGDQVLKYQFDTLNNSSKIDNILNSIVDSRVISEKIHGKASVQVASTLYESNPRQFSYIKDGKYQQLTSEILENISDEERKSIKMTSSDLSFYTNDKGITTKMEVYISWPFKDVQPEQIGMRLENGIYRNTGIIDQRLLSSIGFRIPTQAMNSIENIIIKGFTPANNGDMIVVPSEIVGKSGSDFDIDKLNIYLANYYQNPRTGKLNYVQYKGSPEATRAFYSDLYDKGELLSEQDLRDLDRYIAEETDLTGEEDYTLSVFFKEAPKLQAKLNNILDTELTREFLADMATNTDKKNKVVEALVKKSLQNNLMEVMARILEQQSNYRQLVTPNSVATIKGLATEISRLKINAGTKTVQDEKSYNYLRTFIGSSEIRERYLTAKRMVGIAALHSTFHSMAQVSGTYLTGRFKLKGLKYLAAPKEEWRTINIKLDNNSKQADGTYKIGNRLDVKGDLISESGSEKLSGFVDGAKDPFVFDLNLNMNTASTWFYLDHHGVSQRDIAYFFNQPILDQYFSLQSKNNSGFKNINGNKLFPEGLFYEAIRPYYSRLTSIDIVQRLELAKGDFRQQMKIKNNLKEFLVKNNAKYPKFSASQLRQAIEAGENADPGLQLAVLYNYLELSVQARFLSNYIQAIGYDNSKTKSIQENQMQVAKWDRSKNDEFIGNPDSILEKTFIGEMKTQKEDVFNMFRDFFVTLSPKVQKVFKPIEDQLSDPDFFATKNDMAMLLQRYQNFVLTYILHTTPYMKNEVETAINGHYNMLFGDNSMAKSLAKIKASQDPTIANNMIVREMLPLMTEDITKTDNISLFRNRLDSYHINKLTESIQELKEYAIDTADNELLQFLDNLTRFSIIQSGLQASSINYSTVLPTDIYSEEIKNIISNFMASDIELNIDDVWYNFHANQWQNTAVTPRAPYWNKVKDGVMKVTGTSATAANEFLSKIVRRPGLSSRQITQLVKEKRFTEAFDTLLLRRSATMDSEGKYIYRPVNKKGDGSRFTEISPANEASIMIKNGDISMVPPASGDRFMSYEELMGTPSSSQETRFEDEPPVDRTGDDLPSETTNTEINQVLDDKDQGCKK